MDYKQKLKDLYLKANCLNSNSKTINQETKKYIEIIADNCFRNKGVYTVLVTLLFYKTVHPSQDIRYHQANMKDEQTGKIIGFSGRSFDTKYVTPTLKELDLPSMAESGWLTRSLEQPLPYNLDYEGKITPKKVKQAFLNIINFVQKNPQQTEDLLIFLLSLVIEKVNSAKIKIIKKIDGDYIDIKTIINFLECHFSFNYQISGGSKLPVLAFYAIYQILIQEIARYNNCYLEKLGSHTASDLTSKSAGDIVILGDNKTILEVIEIKYGREIDAHLVRRAKEKIIQYNPVRYYIFSSEDIQQEKEENIQREINQILEQHGCQVIINGIIPTLKYYLRLIDNLKDFMEKYGIIVEEDTELKAIHKNKWNEILLNNLHN